MVIESYSMDTVSTFEQTDDPMAAIAFKGEYVCGEYRVVREYHVAHGSEVLQESTQYYADGWLLRERYDRWIVDRIRTQFATPAALSRSSVEADTWPMFEPN